MRMLLGRNKVLISVCILITACGGGGSGGVGPVTQPPPPPPPPPPVNVVPDLTSAERFSGGDAGTTLTNEDAFGQSPAGIQQDFSADANFKSGNAIFRNDHDGQGPILNAATCQGCHVRDGRGRVPQDSSTAFSSMFLRLGLGNDSDDQTIPDPVYGTQLQTFGLASFIGGDPDAGLPSFGGGASEAIGEAFAFIEYETVNGAFADGTAYELRKPTYKIRDMSYGDFADGLQISPRVAQQMIGLGLLGAIPEASIRALADPNDTDADGISGRVNETFDPTTNTTALGRYGYKATSASVLQQTAGAYRGDIGVTNRFATDESCTASQSSCINAALLETDPHPGDVDISDLEMALVEFYSRLLAVPDRRGFDSATSEWDAEIVAGRTLFFEAGCGGCHTHSFETGEAAGSVLGEVNLNRLEPDAPPIEVLSDQTIYPYTDMLLHDMGGACDAAVREDMAGASCTTGPDCNLVFRCEGLADGRPDLLATGTEWRTAPLWGLGLVQTVSPNATFLHDGRARTIEEAILWHGGEADVSRTNFIEMSATERAELAAFLNSL
ncbi:MAG: di-heme oxidoredictase family protein [Pseudomonadota bacterium]